MSETTDAVPVWLITGCSSGFGAEIARQVLDRGWRAVVTARNSATIEALAASHGDRALALRLDVTDPEQIIAAVDAATARFGRVDVLCNNAGVSYLNSVEESDDARVRALFETNFFGPLALLKAVLPGMRARRSGHILNFSSIGGLAAFPGSGNYAATKFALEGISEALAAEVEPLGIKITLIEPGPFRTGMAHRAEHAESRNPDYEATVHARRAQFRAGAEDMPGDPVRGAAAVIAITQEAAPPLRLLLGKPALEVARKRFQSVLQEFGRWENLTLSADYPASSGDWASAVQGQKLFVS